MPRGGRVRGHHPVPSNPSDVEEDPIISDTEEKDVPSVASAVASDVESKVDSPIVPPASQSVPTPTIKDIMQVMADIQRANMAMLSAIESLVRPQQQSTAAVQSSTLGILRCYHLSRPNHYNQDRVRLPSLNCCNRRLHLV